MLRSIKISYDYLDITGMDEAELEEMKDNFTSIFRYSLSVRWDSILSEVAKQLSYDCLQAELQHIYLNYYYDDAFKRNLRLFNQKFSDNEYWKNHLLKLILQKCNELLQKMYIFDEV